MWRSVQDVTQGLQRCRIIRAPIDSLALWSIGMIIIGIFLCDKDALHNRQQVGMVTIASIEEGDRLVLHCEFTEQEILLLCSL